ncbi:hypothetical protein FRD01_07700 [Microvenator marinus]|uniref:Uncharacterized protein n=1 Tax=Microvenator marinus TaxID=2600177 RepID=A0A5B8XPW0_9DELT|nr:hypothetical protein [Microvenator marinus]QED27127.1 hypothetical protein FRD01_07700 [Microvenator marinus]
MKYTIVLSLLLISTVLTTACTSDLDRNTDGPPDNRDSGSDAQVEPDTGPHDADLADLEDQGDMASIDLGESGDSPPDMVPLDMESGVCARAVARVAHDLSALSDITLEYGRPLKLLHHESSSPAAPIAEHSWKVVTQPVDSPRALQDGFLTPTIAGVYVAELTVRDEAGNTNCNDYDTRFVTVRVTDSPEFIAEISWSGDAEQGPDFDLHYKHPNGQWNNAPWDIYWRNRTSDWGVSGGADDPHLMQDTNTWGYEHVIHRNPESIAYDFGAYVYAFRMRPSSLRASIWIRGQLELVLLENDLEQDQFWHIAEITWPTGQVNSIDNVTSGFPNP